MWQGHTQTGLQGLSSPQVIKSKGKPFPNVGTDQPPEVVISIPDARTTPYSGGGWGGDGGTSPTPYSVYLLTETAGWTSFAPPRQPRLGLSGTTNSVWEILERDLCTFHEERVRWAGSFKPHHKCIFISLKEQIVVKDFSTLFMSQWKTANNKWVLSIHESKSLRISLGNHCEQLVWVIVHIDFS